MMESADFEMMYGTASVHATPRNLSPLRFELGSTITSFPRLRWPCLTPRSQELSLCNFAAAPKAGSNDRGPSCGLPTYQYEIYGSPGQKLKLRSNVKPFGLEATQAPVKVHSAALKLVGYVLMEGLGPAPTGAAPTKEKAFGMGFDSAPIVVQVGNEVQRLIAGDKVHVMMPLDKFGTLVNFVIMGGQYVALKPRNASLDQATGVPLAALMRYQGLLVERTRLQNGKTVLIQGGSSAVSAFIMQFVYAMGARAIATASPKDPELVRSLGVGQIVDYTLEQWVDILPEHSVGAIHNWRMERCAVGIQVDHRSTHDALTGRTVRGQRQVWRVSRGENQVRPSMEDLAPSLAASSEARRGEARRGEATTVLDSVYPFEKVLDAIAKLRTHSRQAPRSDSIEPTAAKLRKRAVRSCGCRAACTRSVQRPVEASTNALEAFREDTPKVRMASSHPVCVRPVSLGTAWTPLIGPRLNL